MIHTVDKQKLIDTVRDLKENRRLSSESEAIMKPFVGGVSEFTFSFFEVSTTFSSRLDDRYAKGKTVVAQFAEFGVECTILFPPSENDWLESLSKEDQFDLKVVVLELDNLYQRVVFGKLFDTDEKDELQAEQPDEVEEEKVSESIDGQEGNLETENTPETVSNIGSSDGNVDAEVNLTVLTNKENDNVVGIEEEVLEEEGLAVEEISALELEGEREVEDVEDIIPLRFDDNDLNNEEEKSAITEKPPSIPSLKVQNKAKEIDYAELERIRDKRYEEGAPSLTAEEKEILDLASKRAKKSYGFPSTDDSSLTSSQNKKKSKKHKVEQGNIVTMGCRGVSGILVGFFGLQALSSAWIFVSIVMFAIAWYLLNPIIKKLRED